MKPVTAKLRAKPDRTLRIRGDRELRPGDPTIRQRSFERYLSRRSPKGEAGGR
jgi:hypothetical protein